jgi:hypothetical protein
MVDPMPDTILGAQGAEAKSKASEDGLFISRMGKFEITALSMTPGLQARAARTTRTPPRRWARSAGRSLRPGRHDRIGLDSGLTFAAESAQVLT